MILILITVTYWQPRRPWQGRITTGKRLRIIIENVSGAGGSIGVGRVARAAADGYTLCVGNLSSHVMNGAVYALPYNVVADFAPVALLSFQPFLIVARKSMLANDLREFVAWLKANSGKASLGIQGVGTAGHVFGVFS